MAQNNMYRWATSQKLLEIDCKWVEETSQFNKYFMKKYSDDSD